MTSGENTYYQWTPADSVWSPWAKPVLFTQLPGPADVPGAPQESPPWQSIDTTWAPPATQKAALVIDLPNDAPLWTGVALANKGYQPVVLYNCCAGPKPVLDLEAVLRTLIAGDEALSRMPRSRRDAPPAFLIDARRRTTERPPAPGLFDNRWVVLPQDFPSATFLKANGVDRVILLHDRDGQPADDLAHVLLRWQEAGLAVAAARPGGTPAELRVTRPSRFRAMWYALLVTAGLRANSAGGFGSLIPEVSHGGG